MKFAKAVLFGGELVEASKATYEDYYRLIPRCPNCGEPVFLRQSHERQGVNIGASWVHHKERSSEDAKVCEFRVKGYTAEEIEKAYKAARNQRLNLLRKKFWQCLRSAPSIDWDREDEAIASAMSDSRTLALCNSLYNTWRKPGFRSDIIEASTSTIEQMYQYVRGERNEKLVGSLKFNCSSQDEEYLRKFIGSWNLEQQIKICNEVTDFLLSHATRNDLMKLLYLAVINVDDMISEHFDRWHGAGKNSPKVTTELIMMWQPLFNITSIICMVNWIKQLNQQDEKKASGIPCIAKA